MKNILTDSLTDDKMPKMFILKVLQTKTHIWLKKYISLFKKKKKKGGGGVQGLLIVGGTAPTDWPQLCCIKFTKESLVQYNLYSQTTQGK